MEDYVQHAIRSLHPAFLSHADWVHFPALQDYCHVWDAYASSSSLSSSTYPSSNDRKHHNRPFAVFRLGNGKPIPAGLAGYFYYYAPGGPVPPTAGEIRFRVIPRGPPNLHLFNQSQNLLSDSERGLPWHLPLTTIAARDSYQVYREVLLRDGLVSPELLARAAEMGREVLGERSGGRKAQVVHGFRQPWFIDFGSKVHWWWFMGADKLHTTPPMPNILSWKVGQDRTPSPWLGTALCSFFPDAHPRLRGHRVVKIKVVKLLSPITPNPEFPEELRYLVSAPEAEPREGAFLRRGQPLWQMDVDREGVEKGRREGFGALFANLGLPPLRTDKALRQKVPGEELTSQGGLKGQSSEDREGRRTLRSLVR
ncbi:hypothetical protein BD309DRAFT_993080 [Dichomitus squalens]|nr:uncharacterized protein DICSQDRAFT_172523 [Dichomitus squalens LYAD-421 SS1]EJF58864.1 hypothetical protein DICSQDRAFT_172523 [Dichomitus squalens LYAD-421 SS1]TBU21937.1 hypothetical protein BD311DRAFT_782629 [Dichomitus squalens]TBU40431.1 hypothetical protein BD309DRAFT_993080 [Dichomitus squalens]